MSTRYSISEQVLLRLRGGRPDDAAGVDQRDIMMAVGQVANMLMGAEYATTVLPSGEKIPDGSMMVTFEDVLVEQYRGVSRVKLPVMPIPLRRGVGVEILKGDGVDCVYIPIMMGQWPLLKSEGLLSDLGGEVCYELAGGYAEFKKDITKLNVTKVAIREIVMDIASYDDYQPLPIPADYEGRIIEQLVQQFSRMLPANIDTDIITDKQKG